VGNCWVGLCFAGGVENTDSGGADQLDAVTEIILSEAVDRCSRDPRRSSLSRRADDRWSSLSRPLPQPIAVLDDVGAALTRELVSRGLYPRIWCDDLREEEAARAAFLTQTIIPANAGISPTIVQTLTGARTVLWRLPKAVSAVDEYAELIATHAAPNVLLVAGGRDKHLSRSMNDALARHFGSVSASLGRRKARALVATGPTPAVPRCRS
jgi:hypothetical protein